MSGDPIRAAKMSGAGNDFVVVGPDALPTLGPDPTDWVRRVCRRGLSVGADGVIFVEPLERGIVRVRFMNPDGSRAFCGNGTRCAARYAKLRGLADDRMVLETDVGMVPATITGDRVDLVLPGPREKQEVELEVDGYALRGSWVEAGSPHFVTWVSDVRLAPLARWAPIVRRHASFGAGGVNVNLVQRLPDGPVALRTWERGVEGETLACGSGAVAAGLVAARQSQVRRVRLVPKSGIPLDVEFAGDLDEPSTVTLSGDARLVFETELGAEATCGF